MEELVLNLYCRAYLGLFLNTVVATFQGSILEGVHCASYLMCTKNKPDDHYHVYLFPPRLHWTCLVNISFQRLHSRSNINQLLVSPGMPEVA